MDPILQGDEKEVFVIPVKKRESTKMQDQLSEKRPRNGPKNTNLNLKRKLQNEEIYITFNNLPFRRINGCF